MFTAIPPATHTHVVIILAQHFYDYFPFPKVVFIITTKQ